MSRKKQLSRILSLVLSLSLVIGMLPATAFATASRAIDGEDTDIIQYKGMGMARTVGNASWLSRYEYSSSENTFQNEYVNFNNGNTLVKLWYTIEKSQPVSLALYKLNKDKEYSTFFPVTVDEKNTFWGLNMPYFYDKTLPDLGASKPEPFLDEGGLIGYLKGYRITENVDDTDEDAMMINRVDLSDERWEQIITEASRDMENKTSANWVSFKDVYAFGFSGEKLVIPPATEEASLEEEIEPVMPVPDEAEGIEAEPVETVEASPEDTEGEAKVAISEEEDTLEDEVPSSEEAIDDLAFAEDSTDDVNLEVPEVDGGETSENSKEADESELGD